MKIKMLTAMAGTNFVYNRGDEVEMADDVATRYINAGIAEPVREEKIERAVTKAKVEKAVK